MSRWPNREPGAPGAPGPQGWGEAFQQMMGLPSPDKIMAELQRLNQNLENLTPDLRKIAASIDGLSPSDVKALASALESAKFGELTQLLGKLYNRIWGK